MLLIKRLIRWEDAGDLALLLPATAFTVGVAAAALLKKGIPSESAADLSRGGLALIGVLPIALASAVGFFCIGVWVIPLLFAMKGYLLGGTVFSFCSRYGLGRGLLASAALLGPSELVLMPLFTLVGASAFARSYGEARERRLGVLPTHLYFIRAVLCTALGAAAGAYGGSLGRHLLYSVIS